MEKVVVELSPHQVEQIVEQLDLRAKLRLAAKLDRQTRQARWQPLVLRMRRRVARRGLSPHQIQRLCERVRQEHVEREPRPARRP